MERYRGLRNFAIVALIALAIALAPGGGAGLNIALWLLTVAFFVSIGFLGYRLYREHRFTIESLAPVERAVAYVSVGTAFVTFTATNRLASIGGGLGWLIWFALLGLCSYGIFWVWRHASAYG
jgi:hypothetical protein